MKGFNTGDGYMGLVDGKYILLHHFMKKAQKTPRREIEKVKSELTEIREQENA